jgi:hypothetical protein
MWKEKLKGKDKFETAENCSITGIAFGVVIISIGFLLSIFNPKGISVILLMLGSLFSFISTVVLIFVWLLKELRG